MAIYTREIPLSVLTAYKGLALIEITHDSSSFGPSESTSSEDEDEDGDSQGGEVVVLEFQVFVHFIGTEKNIYTVSAETLVLGLKRMIEKRKGIPPEEQRLVHHTKQLEDCRPLGFYNIGPYANLHLCSRLPGGGFMV
ncbi:ubiquitin [Elysia marginata]|uniref:Ubiquitin n=1 Tax=Elysia marginata TaxID=1093978 RepID=A0AAV4FY11_9GAST|nr:ubiquitin [Elysia marginata]